MLQYEAEEFNSSVYESEITTNELTVELSFVAKEPPVPSVPENDEWAVLIFPEDDITQREFRVLIEEIEGIGYKSKSFDQEPPYIVIW